MALKEELEILKEEVLIKEEELSKYQRHCSSISDEVILKNELSMSVVAILQGSEQRSPKAAGWLWEDSHLRRWKRQRNYLQWSLNVCTDILISNIQP